MGFGGGEVDFSDVEISGVKFIVSLFRYGVVYWGIKVLLEPLLEHRS